MVATRSPMASSQALTGPAATSRGRRLSQLLSPQNDLSFCANSSPTPIRSESWSTPQDVDAASRSLGQPMHIAYASSENEFEAAFTALARQGVRALLLGTDTIFFNRRDQLIALAASHRIPAIYTFREYVRDGGLISYGPIQTETIRQAGLYAGRILKGAKPADLPVLQPTKFELVINLKTATTLGLEVPWFLQQRADEVIE
jgi:putative ABC transport system substrate-binding protein